jgi:Zn-dependent peptidase ImmA (M78 family)
MEMETEANVFAAAFLMPGKRFKEIAKETADGRFYDTKRMSERFGVYEGAVIFRGVCLGMWGMENE